MATFTLCNSCHMLTDRPEKLMTSTRFDRSQVLHKCPVPYTGWGSTLKEAGASV